MPASDAQIAANRQNSAKSSGPRTIEGKQRSRRNGLKHGNAGEGVVVLEQSADEITRCRDELQAELTPKSKLGAIMVLKMATCAVRMERSSKQESLAIARRVRHACEDYDQEQLDEADRLFDRLGEEPRSNLRKLRKSPEGVDRLLEEWRELRADLVQSPRPAWTAHHRERAENLCGLRIEAAGGSRIGALSKAIWGDFVGLDEQEGGKLGDEARQVWAKDRLVELIDAQIAELDDHFETLDFKTLDLDRAEAPTRALFDPSKEAILARRYESEASRGFYKALKEFRQAEAEVISAPIPVATPVPEAACVELGSSRERPVRAPREPRPSLLSRMMGDEEDSESSASLETPATMATDRDSS